MSKYIQKEEDPYKLEPPHKETASKDIIPSKLDEILDPIFIDYSNPQPQAEAKAKLLQLGLSCLPEKARCSCTYNKPQNCSPYEHEFVKGQNAAIDTMERNIKLKFGGSDEN